MSKRNSKKANSVVYNFQHCTQSLSVRSAFLSYAMEYTFYLEGVVPLPPNKFLETPEAAFLGVVGAVGLCPGDFILNGVSPNWTAVL